MEKDTVTQFHVIDDDHRRRAQISRELMSRGLHAEIYEDAAEFCRSTRTRGVLLASSSSVLVGGEAAELGMPFALYSERPTTSEVVDAITDGAVDYLTWPFTPDALERLLARLDSKRPQLAERRKREQARALVKALSSRELQVLSLVVQGGSSKSIADDLGISPRTVEIHRANVARKLSAESMADAVRVALYAGLDDSPELGAAAARSGRPVPRT